MTSPKELLTHFNLSEQEAEIYLASLTLGKASVNDIAKKIGKSRTAIYFHVDHLLQKGFLKEARHGKLTRLIATPPTEVVSTLDQRMTELKSLIPFLQSLHKADIETPIIEVTESKRGFCKIYDEVAALPVGSVFRVLEGAESLNNELSLLSQRQWFEFFTRIVERKIHTKALFTESGLALPQTKLAKKNIELLRKRVWMLRSIPDRILPLQKMIMFYGNKMAVLFPDTQLVITIQHEGLINQFIPMFDALFEQGKPIEQPWV